MKARSLLYAPKPLPLNVSAASLKVLTASHLAMGERERTSLVRSLSL